MLKRSATALACLAAVLGSVAGAGSLSGTAGPEPPVPRHPTSAIAGVAPAPTPKPARQPTVGLPAQVVNFAPPVRTSTHGTVDYGTQPTPGDDRTGRTTWRVAEGTGNCCENYFTISRGGRLFDFGGTFINFTDDRGLTWKQVRPQTPLVNGEGTIAMAPNGDVIGVGWDPYSGDHLQAFKYEAASSAWFYSEIPLHVPFYDREWVTVIPGPFTILGQTVPYITFLKGGWPSKELWFRSTDGLLYAEMTSKFADTSLNDVTHEWLRTKADASFDWIQPNIGTGVIPLGEGRALARPDFGATRWAQHHRDILAWSDYRFPSGMPEGMYQIDSLGRIHNLIPQVTSFAYRISADGGRTWSKIDVPLPPNMRIEQIDFRANRAAGVAAVVIHAQKAASVNDQDLAYKIGITTNQPVLQRLYQVGLGDGASTAGVGSDVRMDFQTVAIFPDGRLAVSFLDSTTKSVSPTTGALRTSPNVAIELNTTFP
ncbi:MAG: hypothetical protein ABR521_00185 [Gaiellaceae bacterium]